MLIEEFNKLKVGDSIPVLHHPKSLNFDVRQICEINRTTKKIKTIGSNKEYSYKYLKSKNWNINRPAKYRCIGWMGYASKYDVVEKLVFKEAKIL